MFEPILRAVIYLDVERDLVHVYAMGNGEGAENSYFVGAIHAKPFSSEYFEKLGSLIDGYRESHPDVQLAKTSVVIPDSAVVTDTVHVPALNKRAMNASVDVLLSNLYNDSARIRFNRFVSLQTKEYATFSVVGVKRRILASIHKLLGEHQVGIQNITFAANAAVVGATVLSPKLKAASYVLLDVKETYTRLVFVAKGKTVGFFAIPFGSRVISTAEVYPEDSLFDHAAAELLVLNSKEKAKSKALTVFEPEIIEDVDDDEAVDEAEAAMSGAAVPDPAPKLERKRQGRRLPKFMQRPLPESAEGFAYENFRHILKWSLTTVADNGAVTALGAPEAIYVNLPTELGYLLDMANAEGSCGIAILPLIAPEGMERELSALELFGGFYARQYNKANNFQIGMLESLKDGEVAD